jgi:gas vesicle protein
MSEQNNDFGAFLAGFVIGGLVGAATALILAPQSGDEMRAQLSQKSHDLRDMSTERAHEYQERAQTAVSDVRHRATDAGTQAQDQARLVLDKGKQRLGRTSDMSDETVDGVADDLAAIVDDVQEDADSA